jgi:iron complex outermembrane recepter protein
VKIHNLMTATALCAAAGVLCPAIAFAQEASVENDQPAIEEVEDSGEVIIVTGSRIPQLELTSNVPVAVVGAVDVQRDAAINVQDILNELPQVGIGNTRTNSNFLTAANGVSTINLRSLGSNRTLTLVNGRRFIAGVAGTSQVDVNNIPTDLIERIEVVTGGASAIYGSEAVAGVVNFILKDKFEGIGVRAQYNITERGDNPRYFGAITAGTTFGADDRGNVLLNFSYDKDSGLLSRKRAFSAQDCAFLVCGPAAYSSFAPQGRFQLLGANGAANNAFNGQSLFTFDSANNVVTGFPVGSGFNRNGVRRISTPVERYLGAGIVNYDVTDDVEAFAEVTYSRVQSNSSIEPFALNYTDIYSGAAPDIGLSIDNPFIPAAVRAAIVARNSDGNPANDVAALGFRRRQTEVFDRSNDNKRDTWRVTTGIKGALTDQFNFELSYVFGRLHDITSSEALDINKYRNALDAEIDPVTGRPRCRSAAARTEGCVPINLFGFNTVSPEAAAYVRAVVPATEDITNTQHVLSANVAGNLFALPAGDVGIAVGAEYRKEKSVDDFDILTNTGGNTNNIQPDVIGQFDVFEVYGEAKVPILADKPFFNYLGLTGAARYADYSTIGGAFSWNIGAEWAPVEGVRFRAAYANANRAPNINELFSAPAETFAAVNDPCDGTTATNNVGGFGAACRAIPGVAAAIAANGVFQYTLADLQNINGFIGGNTALQEEVAKTLTAGVAISLPQIPGLGLTIDYFDIKVDDAVGTIPRDTSIEQCLLTGDATFCDNVTRNVNTGFVTRVDAQNINVASLVTSGIDVGLRYSLPLGLAADDRLDLTANYTYLLKFENQADPAAPVEDFAGTLGQSKHRLTSRAAYLANNFTFSWQVNFMSSAVSIKDFSNPDPAVVALNRVGDRFYHDAQIRYDIGENKQFGFYVGVDNVFDTQPPYLPNQPFSGSPIGTETQADVYDPFGRRFYAGVQVRF